jgi:hypothetical protein
MHKHPGESVIVFDAPSQQNLSAAIREIVIPQVVQPSIFAEPTPRPIARPVAHRVSIDDSGLSIRPGSSWNEADAALDAARAGIMRYSAARAIAVDGHGVEPETFAAALVLSQVVQAEMFVSTDQPWPPLFRLVATVNEYVGTHELVDALDQYLTRDFADKWFRVPLPCNPVSFTYEETAQGVGDKQIATAAEFLRIVFDSVALLPTKPSHVVLHPAAFVKNQ